MVAARSLLVRLQLDRTDFDRGLAAAAVAARTFRDELESGNDRMSFLVQSALALGPALIPTFAALTPAVAGFSSAIGFSAIGAGVAALAFSGVGTALKAMNDQALDPTEAHMKALTIAMEKLGPAGQNFVVFLQDLRPEMQQLQTIAQEGLFPGLQEGMQSAMDQLPLVQDIIERISHAMGGLPSDAGMAFSGPFWTDFLSFIRDEGAGVLTQFGHSIGQLLEGVAALAMDFAPMSREFISGFDGMASAFSSWAQNLPDTQGFQDFLAYIDRVGPLVMDTLQSLGNAIVQVIEAASGVGISSLRIIGQIANVIAAVADSPVGPTLIGLAAGISAVSRAIALYNLASGGAFIKTINTFATGLGMAGPLVTKASALAGGVSLLALSFTDLDEKMGLSNTLSFGAIGSMFGPWGAAIGATIGLTKDWIAANDDLTDSLRQVDQAISADPLSFETRAKGIQQLEDTANQLAGSNVINVLNDFKVGYNEVANVLSAGIAKDNNFNTLADDAVKATHAAQELSAETMALKQGIIEFGQAVRGQSGFTGFDTSMQHVNEVAGDVIPKLQDLGYSADQIQNIFLTGQGWDKAVRQIQDYNAAADSTKGRTQAVATAIQDLNDPLLTTADSADALKTALDDLLDPSLNAEEAMDKLKTQIRDLGKELKSAAGFTGFSKGALENRAQTREFVADLKDVLVTQVQAGASGIRLNHVLEENRKQFIQAGMAAGFSRKEIERRADAIGLTPRLVKTVFENSGLTQAQIDERNQIDILNSIPKSVMAKIEANGIAADATVKELMAKYDGLSRRQVVTLIKARDEASGVAQNVIGMLNLIPTLKISTIRLNTQHINTITNVTRDIHQPGHLATGGLVTGPGTRTSDSIPAWLSNGEFVVNAAAAARNLPALFAMNAQRFASGGTVTPLEQRQQALADQRTINQSLRGFSPRPGDSAGDVRSSLHQLIQSLRGVFGRGSPLLNSVERLGGHIVSATFRQDQLQKTFENMHDDLRNLRQARSQYRQEVAGSINNDPFTGGLAAFNLQIRADRNDNRKMLHYLRIAERKGLDGPLLRAAAASGDLQFVMELSKLGRRGIHREEVMFQSRLHAQRSLGAFASNQVFGDRIEQQTKAMHRMERRINQMSRHIRHMDNHMERNVERGTHRGTQRRNRRHAAQRQARR